MPQRSSFIKSERIIGLDLVRAIAILAVVFAHSSPLLLRCVNAVGVGSAMGTLLGNTFPLGILGVELFFVLSGFLIGGILIRTFLDSEAFTFPEVRRFWVRRWFRTLPNYWLILTADILLYKVLGLTSLDKSKLLFYPFLQNLWYPHPLYFFGEAWSLSIEEWFYLTLPVVMYVSYRIFSPGDKKYFLLKVFAGYLLIFVITRFINAFHPINGPDQDIGIRKVVVFRLDAVMYGVLVAWFNYFYPEILSRARKILLTLSVAGAAVIYWMIIDPQIRICDPPSSSLRFFSDAFFYALVPLLFCLCLPAASSMRKAPRRLAAAVQHVSKISYSIYLVHFSLLFVPLDYFLRIASPAVLLCIYVLYWVAVLVLSSFLYRYFELPAMNLRDRGAKKPAGRQ